jgi:hypothetical protein
MVRDMLLEAKFEVVGDNPMASIHQILKRLVAREGKIVADVYDGQTMYRYDPSNAPGRKSPPLTPPLPRPRGVLAKAMVERMRKKDEK